MAVAAPGAERLRRQRFTPGAGWWLPLLLFPISIGLGLVYFSAIQGLALGFTDWNLISPASWVGVQNFAAILNDPRFWLAMRNTFTIVLMTIPAKVVLGLGLAVLLNRIVRGGSFFRLALFFPTSCSVVAVAFLWTYLYDADGLFNKVLTSMGMGTIEWMAPGRALTSISTMIIWGSIGYVSLLFVVITSMIAAFQTFGEVYVLSGPMDSTLTIMSYIYERAFTSFEMGYAAALSGFLIVVILIVTLIQLRLQKRWVTYDL